MGFAQPSTLTYKAQLARHYARQAALAPPSSALDLPSKLEAYLTESERYTVRELARDCGVRGDWTGAASFQSFVTAAVVRRAREQRARYQTRAAALREAADYFGFSYFTLRNRLRNYEADDEG